MYFSWQKSWVRLFIWYSFLDSHGLGHFSMLSIFEVEWRHDFYVVWPWKPLLTTMLRRQMKCTCFSHLISVFHREHHKWIAELFELVTATWRISLAMMSMRRCYQVRRSSANFGTTQMSWRKESIPRKWASCQNGGWRTGSVLLVFVPWSWSVAERSQSHSAYFVYFSVKHRLPHFSASTANVVITTCDRKWRSCSTASHTPQSLLSILPLKRPGVVVIRDSCGTTANFNFDWIVATGRHPCFIPSKTQ